MDLNRRPFRKIGRVTLYIILVLSTLFLVVTLLSMYSEKTSLRAEKTSFGVSFSPQYTEYLGLDWKITYLQVLDDLNTKNIRIPSYWTSIEKTPSVYNFEETDYMVNLAKDKGVKVTLVLGIKQPRWPECHIPDWVRHLSKKERQEKTLDFIKNVVEHYKDSQAIWAWQVENEPFFYPYGQDCYPPDVNFFKKEVNLVRSLDKRSIIISETGELAPWLTQMQLSDIFGTTLYRTVYNKITGYFSYPVLPGYYSLRSNFFRKFFAPNNQKTIIVELQAEPWIPSNSPMGTTVESQLKIFPLEKMKENVEFAKKTGFDEIYLWGVEWWYFMKQKGHPEYWEYAKTLF